jgi:hypothetical protein
MANYGTWLTLISFLIIPLVLLAMAIFTITILKKRQEKSHPDSFIKKLLDNHGNWKDPHWLRNRIDMIFSLLLAVVFILITVIYS